MVITGRKQESWALGMMVFKKPQAPNVQGCEPLPPSSRKPQILAPIFILMCILCRGSQGSSGNKGVDWPTGSPEAPKELTALEGSFQAPGRRRHLPNSASPSSSRRPAELFLEIY